MGVRLLQLCYALINFLPKGGRHSPAFYHCNHSCEDVYLFNNMFIFEMGFGCFANNSIFNVPMMGVHGRSSQDSGGTWGEKSWETLL